MKRKSTSCCSKISAGVVACLACLCIAGSPPADERLLRSAADCRLQGRALEALSFYRDALLNAGPGKASCAIYQGLADIYYEYLDDLVSARRFYEEMLRACPEQAFDALQHHRLARLYCRCGEKAAAIRWYQSLAKGFPDYAGRHGIAAELQAVERGDAQPDEAGTAVERIFPGRIRVLVYEGREPVRLTADADLEARSPGAAPSDKMALPRQCVCSALGDEVIVAGLPARPGPLRVAAAGQHDICVTGTAYRGFLEVRADAGRLLVVNHVDLEEYLCGVLPREMSPGWPAQALKAQAVAARTYALYNMVKRAAYSYDVFATTASQMYGGRKAESEATTRAVQETSGQVLACGSRIALTLYHANSGGRTEAIDSVWGSSQPYLQSVADSFSAEQPGAAWRQSVAIGEVQQRLSAFGLPAATVQDIIPRDRAASGRITRLEIVQPEKSLYLTGNSFRLIVGPARIRSSHFSVAQSDGQFVFEGRGYGHGVGMSQWGARSMAKQGHSLQRILAFY